MFCCLFSVCLLGEAGGGCMFVVCVVGGCVWYVYVYDGHYYWSANHGLHLYHQMRDKRSVQCFLRESVAFTDLEWLT